MMKQDVLTVSFTIIWGFITERLLKQLKDAGSFTSNTEEHGHVVRTSLSQAPKVYTISKKENLETDL